MASLMLFRLVPFVGLEIYSPCCPACSLTFLLEGFPIHLPSLVITNIRLCFLECDLSLKPRLVMIRRISEEVGVGSVLQLRSFQDIRSVEQPRGKQMRSWNCSVR